MSSGRLNLGKALTVTTHDPRRRKTWARLCILARNSGAESNAVDGHLPWLRGAGAGERLERLSDSGEPGSSRQVKTVHAEGHNRMAQSGPPGLI